MRRAAPSSGGGAPRNGHRPAGAAGAEGHAAGRGEARGGKFGGIFGSEERQFEDDDEDEDDGRVAQGHRRPPRDARAGRGRERAAAGRARAGAFRLRAGLLRLAAAEGGCVYFEMACSFRDRREGSQGRAAREAVHRARRAAPRRGHGEGDGEALGDRETPADASRHRLRPLRCADVRRAGGGRGPRTARRRELRSHPRITRTAAQARDMR